jgi:hypothetical protein
MVVPFAARNARIRQVVVPVGTGELWHCFEQLINNQFLNRISAAIWVWLTLS